MASCWSNLLPKRGGRMFLIGLSMLLCICPLYTQPLDSLDKEQFILEKKQLQQNLALFEKRQRKLLEEIALLKTELETRKNFQSTFSKDTIQQIASRQVVSNKGKGKLVLHIFIVVLILFFLFFCFKGTAWIYRKVCKKYEDLQAKKLKPLVISNYELLSPAREVIILKFITNIMRCVVNMLLIMTALFIIFSIFPITKGLAYKLSAYAIYPLKTTLNAIIEYIPNLVTIIITYILFHYLQKLIAYLAREAANGRLRIKGFHVDWVRPTHTIIKYLLYIFMMIIIYPYLPGSGSSAFQGITVFVGLLLSLGSTSLTGNLLGGIAITYMRSFKIGDRISLNNIEGEVVGRGPLITRIRTYKNELITIPNGSLMTTHSINLSQSAKRYGLIIHSEVSIGYDIPWRKVHELLIRAALITEGIEKTPEPFVLETSLTDNYPVYQVNAMVKQAKILPQIYSLLHQNIQDVFAEAGVEILSPHYRSVRDGNKSTISNIE